MGIGYEIRKSTTLDVTSMRDGLYISLPDNTYFRISIAYEMVMMHLSSTSTVQNYAWNLLFHGIEGALITLHIFVHENFHRFISLSLQDGDIYYMSDKNSIIILHTTTYRGLTESSVWSTQLAIQHSVDLRIRVRGILECNQVVFSDNQVKNNLSNNGNNPSIFDHIEMTNIGDEAINLYLCKFINGITFTSPNIIKLVENLF